MPSRIEVQQMASKPQPTAEAGPVRKRGHGVQKVYEKLRQSILDLSLPPGSPLDEMRLSEEFDLSRTPIREAMVRLAAEGLLTTLPNRNTIVAPIDFLNLPVYFEALTLMYRVTTRAAAVHRRPEHLVRIRAFEAAYADAVRRHDALGMIAINRDFHVAVAEAGGNVYFTQLFARLGAEVGEGLPAPIATRRCKVRPLSLWGRGLG
jgi:DNA-binding GntR family transcriptional regulator